MLAANAAGGFVALDFGKQPHREDHEEAEECDDVLDAVVAEYVLIIGRDSRYQDNNQRKSDLIFTGIAEFS